MIGWVLLGACHRLPPCEGGEYVAMQADFADYTRWVEVALEHPDPRLGEGPRSVYLNARPPRGAAAFPQCTILVKQDRSDPDPAGWWTLGMAKRGGGVNAGGAAGWEWFGLEADAEGGLSILWRGSEPPDGHGYGSLGGADSDGGTALGDCNTCHAAAAANDFVLTAELALE